MPRCRTCGYNAPSMQKLFAHLRRYPNHKKRTYGRRRNYSRRRYTGYRRRRYY